MSNIVLEVANMISILPENEQKIAYDFIKNLVLTWDPDFTKLTKKEQEELENAENSGFIDEKDIDFDKLSDII